MRCGRAEASGQRQVMGQCLPHSLNCSSVMGACSGTCVGKVECGCVSAERQRANPTAAGRAVNKQAEAAQGAMESSLSCLAAANTHLGYEWLQSMLLHNVGYRWRQVRRLPCAAAAAAINAAAGAAALPRCPAVRLLLLPLLLHAGGLATVLLLPSISSVLPPVGAAEQDLQ